MEIAVEVAGWVGAVLILIAYLLVSSGRLEGGSVPYQVLNLFGSLGFILNTAWHGAIPSTVLNIIWFAIAIFTLARVAWPGGLRSRRHR
ncbi:MAG TPA: hypothetical protein VFX27_03640 [Sphingobium sp.]|jgi:formate hydrogenlyase subunit 3/multisubunit Na+/H+ antiporter MnhD subunit|nr:hypothetical protein [Sphingobium sp.]